jgi:L-asparagine transporter-like permease
MPQNKKAAQEEGKMAWWRLSLLGVACTVGTGFFLGSHLAIEVGGPAVLSGYVLAAFSTYLVFDMLAQMTALEPLEGSFRSYAKKAFGRWAGFSSGWVYWSSELLIMGSQLTALSLFSRFWFPQMPMWSFAAIFGSMGLLVIVWGAKGFERVENVFAVMKISALIMFIVIAALVLSGVFTTQEHGPALPVDWLPAGATGLWAALIFAFYGYGGIEVVGLLAVRLKNPDEAPKAGKIMLLMLAVLYVISIGLVLMLEPWQSYTAEESPFIVSLADYNMAFVPHLFNAVLIIAGFSTMTASLFAVTTMIVTLAKDHDAPSIFARGYKEGKKQWAAIALTAAGLAGSVIFALLMPGSVYEYITTAAGIMLLYNWLFILLTSGRLLPRSGWNKVKQYTGMAFIVLTVTGTLFHPVSRPGFFISLGFVGVIGAVTLIMKRKWKKPGTDGKRNFLSEQYVVSFESEIQAEPDKGQAGNNRNNRKEPAR